jgi:hypothetical protein
MRMPGACVLLSYQFVYLHGISNLFVLSLVFDLHAQHFLTIVCQLHLLSRKAGIPRLHALVHPGGRRKRRVHAVCQVVQGGRVKARRAQQYIFKSACIIFQIIACASIMQLRNKFPRISPGSCLHLDLTHAYYGIYYCPYANLTEFLSRLDAPWRDHSAKCGLDGAVMRGSNAKCSLAAWWSLLSMLGAARTVTAAQQQCFLLHMESLWMPCKWSGRLRIGTFLVEVLEGHVDGQLMLQVFFADIHVRATLCARCQHDSARTCWATCPCAHCQCWLPDFAPCARS